MHLTSVQARPPFCSLSLSPLVPGLCVALRVPRNTENFVASILEIIVSSGRHWPFLACSHIMVSIVPLQRRTEASSAAAAARSIFSLERRRRDDEGAMDLSGTQGELPIPMHVSPYGAGGSAAAAAGHVLQLHHHEPHGNNNNNNGGQSPAAPLPPSPPPAAEEMVVDKKRSAAGIGGAAAVRYRECLKNHAAAIGGNATDGCGEFMPSGEDGSLESLKCSACGCHRNFHRKELDADDDHDDIYSAAAVSGDAFGRGRGHAHRRLLAPAMPHHTSKIGGGGLLVSAAGDPYGAYARALPPPPGHHHHHQYVMPLSMIHQHQQHTSESDEMEGAAAGGGGLSSSGKKRFRTKFTPEQKARMLEFAERVGWRLQKLDDGMVQGFCQEIGVKRRVLKVWMHNNKHNLATSIKRLEDSSPQDQSMASPPPPAAPQMAPLQMIPAGVMPPPQAHHGGPGSPGLKLE